MPAVVPMLRLVPALVIAAACGGADAAAEALRITLPSGKSFLVGEVLSSEAEYPPDEVIAAYQRVAWDHVAKRAAAATGAGYSADKAALAGRERWKAWFAANYAAWKAPEPPAPPPGKLRCLADEPQAPRFPLTGKTWPEKAGQAEVCLWEDDKTAAFSFSVDDNNAQDVAAWKTLSQRYGGLNVSFNLITYNIDGAFNPGQVAMFGTWDSWAKVVDGGWHVASHSMTHLGNTILADGWPGPDFEAAESKRLLDAHLPKAKARLFIDPGATVPEFGYYLRYKNPPHEVDTYRAAVAKWFIGNRRGSTNPINPANQIDYFAIRTTQVAAACIGPKAMFDITKVLDADPKNAFYRGWFTTFTHGINKGATWDTDPFTIGHGQVFAWVDQHRDEVWVGFMDDVATYGQERDTATLATAESGDARIVLELVSRMDPAVFDYPLTIKVRLPDAWQACIATQDGAPIPVQRLVHGGGTFALAKARPDRGRIVLTP